MEPSSTSINAGAAMANSDRFNAQKPPGETSGSEGSNSGGLKLTVVTPEQLRTGTFLNCIIVTEAGLEHFQRTTPETPTANKGNAMHNESKRPESEIDTDELPDPSTEDSRLSSIFLGFVMTFVGAFTLISSFVVGGATGVIVGVLGVTLIALGNLALWVNRG